MTYTAVVPVARWESNRQDINDFLSDMIAAFQSQVPGVIRRQWSEIPASYTGETPLIYLGDLIETITHDSGLRVTSWTGQIGYIDTSPDNQEANTRANVFADYMRELFTANARIKPPGILAQTGLREAPATDGPLYGFMHLVLDFTYQLQEGRS